MTDSAALPDLANGVAIDRLSGGGMLQGTVGSDEVLLVRKGDEFFAVGARCTHYSGALVEGLVVGDEVRCPLHHACFNLRTGEAVRGPAFDPVSCWRVERVGDRVFVREKLAAPGRPKRGAQGGAARVAAGGPAAVASLSGVPASVVIVGGGPAGLSAADTLRREGYDGPVTLISADDSAPYDRPNLSKDYLGGTASDDWIPLRSPDYYTEQRIRLLLSTRVSALDLAAKRVQVEGGEAIVFDRLLLATGADPVKLTIPGAAPSQIHYLRTYADSRALAAKAAMAKTVVILGGSFIGLEVAATLRERGLAVHVVAMEKQPLERVLGPDIGRLFRTIHESHGVVFHLEDTITQVSGSKVTLRSGTELDADLLVLGVGVQPALALAEQAGLKVDRGVLVDEYLQTSQPGVFAAGDIARWPDSRSGERIRVEHWVVAERQGQVAARNILGLRQRFDAVPFFWTRQFDTSIKYIGHAQEWDAIEVDGSIEAKNCTVTYKRAGRVLAVATIGRNVENLRIEAEMEAGIR